MAKRRASIHGRGPEILRGAPALVEIQPRGPGTTLPEELPPEPESPEMEPLADQPAPSEPESLLDEAELERALYEEAKDGEPDPNWTEEDMATLDEEPPPTPEIEAALMEEAIGAEEPPEPVEELPIPTLEETMEEKELSEDAALHEPPPPETSDVASGVLPARPTRAPFDLGEIGSLAADIQASEEGIEPFELPHRELTEEEEKTLLARLGRARIRELSKEIEKAYDQVLSKVGENESITTECYNQLLKAQDIVLRRDASRIPQAEYYVEQVRARLKRAAESETAAKKYAWWIAAWGLLWFVAYVSALILLNFGWLQKVAILSEPGAASADMEVFLQALVWGGIGGVAAVFYSLFKHVSRRDFDSQYNLTYVGKPFLGVILGATVYMVIHLLIMTLGIMPAGLQNVEGASSPVIMPWIIYVTAWSCGFKENRIFDLVDRVMKRIFSAEGSEPPPEAAGPAG